MGKPRAVNAETDPGIACLIGRGPRAFVQLAAMGECDDKGKTVLSFGYKGKSVAPPDQPLLLASGFIEQIMPFCHWSSVGAMEADLSALKKYVDGLEAVPRDETKGSE